MVFIENRISFVCIDTSELAILMDLPHICWLIIDKLSLPSLVLFGEMNFYYLFVQWYYWGCSAVHCSKQYRSFIVNENVHWHAKQNSLDSYTFIQWIINVIFGRISASVYFSEKFQISRNAPFPIKLKI